MLGYSQGRDRATHFSAWERLVHPDDKASVLARVEDHIRGITPHLEAEHRLKTKWGTWKWVLSLGKMIDSDEKGVPTRILGTHLDITERR